MACYRESLSIKRSDVFVLLINSFVFLVTLHVVSVHTTSAEIKSSYVKNYGGQYVPRDQEMSRNVGIQ
jgi:hypothetical protein